MTQNNLDDARPSLQKKHVQIAFIQVLQTGQRSKSL